MNELKHNASYHNLTHKYHKKLDFKTQSSKIVQVNIMNTKHWSSTLGTELDWVEEEYLSLNLG
ncbi:hypothetical protein LEP1GSC018_3205, partial [Leptospira kirschneri str. 2008720114]